MVEEVERGTQSAATAEPSERGLEACDGARSGEGKLRFARSSAFQREVRRRVSEELARAGVLPRDDPRMRVKTAVLLLWLVLSYALLVFVATTWWQGALLAVSLGLAMAGVGFGIQHDANHGAYSEHRGVNRVLGLTLDLIGGSSYVWRWKHNVAHHTYTNVAGADDDIDLGGLARLSPAQPRHRVHRLQHVYIWPLYALLVLKWHLVGDALHFARGRIGRTPLPPPRGWDAVELVVGKALFCAWAFVLPALFHPLWVVLAYYALTAVVAGLVLSVVFQLAHCVEEADFAAVADHGRLPGAWAVYQVQSTVNFAPRSRWLSWYLGGLNFQIEHHLFPRVSHVHYPRIARVVRDVCAEFGVRYTVHDTVLSALVSHVRWLRRMGGGGAAIRLAPARAM